MPPALIRKVCEAGTFAPSGGNRQPWFFIAVTEAERRAWVAERYRRVFRSYIAPAIEAARDAGLSGREARATCAPRSTSPSICTKRRCCCSSPAGRAAAQPQLQALFPAIQNILLACRAVGLGASLTTVHTAFGREIDEWLGLPENCPTCAMLPIGWPRGTYRRPSRRSVDECLFFERTKKANSNFRTPDSSDRTRSRALSLD